MLQAKRFNENGQYSQKQLLGIQSESTGAQSEARHSEIYPSILKEPQIAT